MAVVVEPSLEGGLGQMKSPCQHLQDTFTVLLDRAGGASLGVKAHVQEKCLFIEHIDVGLVEAWNAKAEFPHLRIEGGDKVVDVNGVNGCGAHLLRECQSSQMLNITILKQVPSHHFEPSPRSHKGLAPELGTLGKEQFVSISTQATTADSPALSEDVSDASESDIEEYWSAGPSCMPTLESLVGGADGKQPNAGQSNDSASDDAFSECRDIEVPDDFHWICMPDPECPDSSDDEGPVNGVPPRSMVFEFASSGSELAFRPLSSSGVEAANVKAGATNSSCNDLSGSNTAACSAGAPRQPTCEIVEHAFQLRIDKLNELATDDALSEPSDIEALEDFQWTRMPDQECSDSSDDEAPVSGVVPRAVVFEFASSAHQLGFRPLR